MMAILAKVSEATLGGLLDIRNVADRCTSFSLMWFVENMLISILEMLCVPFYGTFAVETENRLNIVQTVLVGFFNVSSFRSMFAAS